jgi:hypothetical protein
MLYGIRRRLRTAVSKTKRNLDSFVVVEMPRRGPSGDLDEIRFPLGTGSSCRRAARGAAAQVELRILNPE